LLICTREFWEKEIGHCEVLVGLEETGYVVETVVVEGLHIFVRMGYVDVEGGLLGEMCWFKGKCEEGERFDWWPVDKKEA
jgi:hypothetical protein